MTIKGRQSAALFFLPVNFPAPTQGAVREPFAQTYLFLLMISSFCPG